MDKINSIIEDLYKRQMADLEKHIEDAFQKHFGISIHDVDLREIEHITIEGGPIESFRYRGETFLYVQELPGDIEFSKDSVGAKVIFTTQYREV